MFRNTRSNRLHLAAAIAVNLALAVVVALGIMLRPLNVGMVLPALPAATATDAMTPSGAAAGVGAEQAAGAGGGSASARANTRRGTTKSKVVVAGNSAAAGTAVLAATGPGPSSVVVTQGPVPRVEPTKAALRAAIKELDARTNLFRPTENQVREFGDQTCTAFDQGYSAAQVKSAVLDSAKKKVPFLRISSADADYAIRTAVGLFCPGHQSLVP
ncbi:MAG: hypothetical protein ACRD0Q_10980 [Acidimicrobiales bacterium]